MDIIQIPKSTEYAFNATVKLSEHELSHLSHIGHRIGRSCLIFVLQKMYPFLDFKDVVLLSKDIMNLPSPFAYTSK